MKRSVLSLAVIVILVFSFTAGITQSFAANTETQQGRQDYLEYYAPVLEVYRSGVRDAELYGYSFDIPWTGLTEMIAFGSPYMQSVTLSEGEWAELYKNYPYNVSRSEGLTYIPLFKSESVSYSTLLAAYKAYYALLTEVTDEYGIGINTINMNYFEDFQAEVNRGVTHAELIDFDNNGLPELLYIYDSGDLFSLMFGSHCLVYGYADNLKQYYEADLGGEGGYGSWYSIETNRDGIKYFNHGEEFSADDRDSDSYYTVEDNTWVLRLIRSRRNIYSFQPYSSLQWQVNDMSVSEQVYNSAPADRLNIVSTRDPSGRGGAPGDSVRRVLAELETRIAEFEIYVSQENIQGQTPEDSGLYEYQPLTPGGGFVVRPGDLERISDAQSARSAIHDAIASLTPEQRRSGDALDTVTLFIENAVRSGASRNVYGEVSLSAPVLEDLSDMAREILYSAGDSLVGEDVSLLRRLRNNVNIKTDETDSLVIAFPDDVSGVGFDSVTVEAEFASVTLNRESILRGGGVEVVKGGVLSVESGVIGGGSDDSGGSGKTPGDSGSRGQGDRGVGFWRNIRPLDVWSVAFIVLVLVLWGVLAACGHKFRAWVVPVFCVVAVAANAYTFFAGDGNSYDDFVKGRPTVTPAATHGGSGASKGNGAPGSVNTSFGITDKIEVILSEGVRATVSLPAYGGEKDYLVLLSEEGIPQYSKYNPVTDMVDTRIRESGVYTLREYTMSFIDAEQKSDLMKEAISQLASRNIMTGTTDGFFFPDMPITRAQLVSAIVRAFDLLDPDAVSGFEDLSRSDWYYAAVATAERENLISGFEDNTFRGEIDIPKDQLVAITANTLIERMGYIVPYEIEELLAIYLDRDTLAPWSEDRIALATQSNIMIYRTDSLFAPRSIMTRGDAAIVLYRVFNKVW